MSFHSQTNLFPAILIAGPPHSGKSVLSFLLSIELRKMGIAHYLLRADPSGEGDWFHLGKTAVVRPLRQEKRGPYTAEFVQRVTRIVQNRLLPLLVDVGGKPRGAQFDVLRACTHAILLYRTEQERARWREYLAGMPLTLVAELRSDLEAPEHIDALHPFLKGGIGGLERHHWRTGVTFGALLERVAGICHYDEAHLARIHRSAAPLPFLDVRVLAEDLGKERPKGDYLHWEPEDLRAIPRHLPAHQPWAIYGRGPVWLSTFLALRAAPAPVAFFDARYGWVPLPEIHFVEHEEVDTIPEMYSWDEMDAICTRWKLSAAEIEPGAVCMPPMVDGENGLVLSAPWPRWLFAAVARATAPRHRWLALDDPGQERIVVVHGRQSLWLAGDTLPRPECCGSAR